MQDFRSLNLAEIEQIVEDFGEKKYRAKQAYLWARKGIESYDEMTNTPQNLREHFAKSYKIVTFNLQKRLESAQDFVVKYLCALHDGEQVESVLMKYKHGYSLCVSTQVGCKMGCKFCVSSQCGFVRNLTAGEIEGQIHFAEKESGIKISNVVFMGIGEPLDNFENVVRAVELIQDPHGLNISPRKISISTCGLVDKIYDLLKVLPKFTLSISLHAPNDETRKKIMPITNKWSVSELLKACFDYQAITNRRISYEYVLIDGVNTSDEQAIELAKILKNHKGHVNLIRVNKGRENIDRPKIDTALRFRDILMKHGINVTIRRTLGADIDAACGQLKNSNK